MFLAEEHFLFHAGLQDRSGMQFYFTRQQPTHLAGILSLGYPITPDLVVPPGADNFTVQAICSAACLERVKYFDNSTTFHPACYIFPSP